MKGNIEKFIRSVKLHLLSDLPLDKRYKELYNYLDSTFSNLYTYKYEDRPYSTFYGLSENEIIMEKVLCYGNNNTYFTTYIISSYIEEVRNLASNNVIIDSSPRDILSAYFKEFLNIYTYIADANWDLL